MALCCFLFLTTGINCSKNINECRADKGNELCQQGVCVDGIGEFTCKCDIGWEGTYCDTDINECLDDYCKNNITCDNTDGNYTCTCLPGYTGRNCTTDIDECASLPCAHNGNCTNKVSIYKLVCFTLLEKL